MAAVCYHLYGGGGGQCVALARGVTRYLSTSTPTRNNNNNNFIFVLDDPRPQQWIGSGAFHGRPRRRSDQVDHSIRVRSLCLHWHDNRDTAATLHATYLSISYIRPVLCSIYSFRSHNPKEKHKLPPSVILLWRLRGKKSKHQINFNRTLIMERNPNQEQQATFSVTNLKYVTESTWAECDQSLFAWFNW